MSFFNCPQCSKTFLLKRGLLYHLEHDHSIAPAAMDSMMGPGPSQAIKLGSNISTSSTPPAGDISPAIGRFKVVLKVNFHVEFDLGREDEAQPIRMTIPKDEPYDKFLSRLRNIFHGDSFERSLRRWEYVLVNRQYEKAAPLPLTSPNTYYAMISELLSTRSRWRHALVRRSVSLI